VSALDTPSTPSTPSTGATAVGAPVRTNPPRRKGRWNGLTIAFLVFVSLLWLFPLFWAVLSSLRDYQYTSKNGYISLGGWTLQNYKNAWAQADFTTHFLNSVYVTVPAVLLTLFLASMVAFIIARFSWRFNIVMLGLFTAANLLPQQALLIPLYRLAVNIPLPPWMSDSELLYDSYWVLILVNTAFQTGFCTFVLSNYMKALPKELYEAAQVDGASIWKQYWTITMPLCRPALAALATLEVTWIYNEFFWATVLLRSGDKFPVTSSLNNLRGQFFTDNNLVSAGSVIVAAPVIIIFFLLQKHFVAGLTLGANKG
jgi:multiple sugar transport system permease protein